MIDELILLISILYGIRNLTHEKAITYVTHWVWIFHCIANVYRFCGSDNFVKKILLLTSFIASMCVFTTICLLTMVKTDDERWNVGLNRTEQQNDMKLIAIRGTILHILPCITSYYVLKKFNIRNLPAYAYFIYLIIPSIPMVIDIIFPNNNFNLYNTYLNYGKEKSNKYMLSQLQFLIMQLITTLLTILIIIIMVKKRKILN